jgi:hypothetical protein
MVPLSKTMRVLCWVLLVHVFAFAINLRGLQNLGKESIANIFVNANQPVEEEVEKDKDCVDLFYISHSHEINFDGADRSWVNRDQHFYSLPLPGPTSPPPDLI